MSPATNALSPVSVDTTRTARITAAAGTGLTQSLFVYRFEVDKSPQWGHLEFPCRACAHCKGFAPAAPRRAMVRVSVPFSGLLLSQPVRITGLVSHYLTNSLIRRNPVLRRPKALANKAFQHLFAMRYYPQFPKVIPHHRVG